jgi:hypothetical protein
MDYHVTDGTGCGGTGIPRIVLVSGSKQSSITSASPLHYPATICFAFVVK